MIRKAISDFLVFDGSLDSCREPFVSAIRLGDKTIRDRNDARRLLRHEIGDAITAGAPQIQKHTSVTLRTVSSEQPYHLRGEYSQRSSIVQIDVWAKGRGAAMRCPYVAELIRIAMSSYRGSDWSKNYPVDVATVIVLRNNSFDITPKDGSNDWTHRHSMDVDIKYQTSVVEFATNAAQPDFTVSLLDSARLKLANTSVLLKGRTAKTVKWTATDELAASVTWQGDPNAPTTEPHTTGIYDDTEIDATTAGLGMEIEVELAVTDDNDETVVVKKSIQRGQELVFLRDSNSDYLRDADSNYLAFQN